MKKIYASLLALAFSVMAYSQACTPGTYPTSGIFPPVGSTLSGTDVYLPEAAEGSFYSQVIDLVVPTDTLIDTLGTTLTATIDSLVVYDVVGLPAGMSYTCNTSTCGWAGGTSGCIELYGTPTTQGTTNIVVYVDAHAQFFGLPVVQSDVINYFYITVNAPVSVEEQLEASIQVYPNPATDLLHIDSDGFQSFEVMMFDALGREMYRDRWTAGNSLDVSHWARGIYSVVIESNGHRIIRKVVIQ